MVLASTKSAEEIVKPGMNVSVNVMGKKFVQMLEHNEHEGETWCFWLQLDGNEEAIDLLIDLIEEEELEESYEFTGVIADDSEVEVLLRLGNFGYNYMSQHHKCEGKLTFPSGFQVNYIYKGRIEDFFKVM